MQQAKLQLNGQLNDSLVQYEREFAFQLSQNKNTLKKVLLHSRDFLMKRCKEEDKELLEVYKKGDLDHRNLEEEIRLLKQEVDLLKDELNQ